MKLPQTVQTKYTTRVFNKKHKYKIVILSKAANLFRGDLSYIERISDIGPFFLRNCSEDDKKFILHLIQNFKKMQDYFFRIESPYINFYTNNAEDIEKLAKIDPGRIKYVCYPEPGTEDTLEKGIIITKRLDYAYRVTMGPTRKNYKDFLNWAKDKRLKIPKTCERMLSREKAWGGYYFYVKDDKLLTLVKMFLGSDIQLVEPVKKQ